ncbi:flavin-containing monooxygenase [Phenylobacterium sp.]|uniref:flavin-containing monooxygenase n=1 Tax=Phenylobacterium sp. TaxID=1871053 RepID=UPI0035ADD2BC
MADGEAGSGKVCVVGAGPAGMAIARALIAQEIDFDIFERHHDVGGLWDQTNPGSPVYDSAHFISSKTQSHYHDFPMPDHYPDYPSHRQILAYMRGFADAYGLRERIRFDVGVTSAVRDGDGWTVETSDGRTGRYAALICATGTNWSPAMPAYPGEFTGEMRHSHSYRSMSEFAGKRVLVIGAGNSGVDIACDAAQSAAHAAISMRRGYHFVPKHIFGTPSDEFAASGPHLPMWLTQKVFAALIQLLHGKPSRYGLQEPDHRLFETHPIMNTQLLHHLAHGDIEPKPDVERFEGRTVHFKDGTAEEFDLILCATGYTWVIPYLAAERFKWKGGRPDLYMNLFSREDRSLYALGYMETNGGAYKLFDEMADLIARTIAARRQGGTAAAAVDRLIREDSPDLSGGIQFVGSARHSTYVEISAYRKHMDNVRKRLGWPGLKDGVYDRLRATGADARAAA